MDKRWMAALAMAGALQSSGALAEFKMLPAKTYFVKNNAAVAVTCSISATGTTWGDWFTLAPGQEWSEKSKAPRQMIRCRAPVSAAFPILPGKRYSFLRERSGSAVSLKQIEVADAS